jgi:hypothetical protein
MVLVLIISDPYLWMFAINSGHNPMADDNISILFWSGGNNNEPRPPDFAHKFTVRRTMFEYGIPVHVDRLDLWMLDSRGIDKLLDKWNDYPTSIHGRAWQYERVYETDSSNTQ